MDSESGSNNSSSTSSADSDSIFEEKLSFGQKTKRFFRKYFLEGQKLNLDQQKAVEQLGPDASFAKKILVNHRRLVGILIPFTFFQICWWSLAIKWDYFSLFPDRYQMTITMIFGSLIAGMTSEGGGAVAFPVMTLVLGIDPSVARDFSLMIQSCGMTAASFTIFWMKITVEWHSLVCCSFGAVFGLIFGLEVVDPVLSKEIKKLWFVCTWFSFCFALFILNRHHNRRTFDKIPSFNWWRGLVLVILGFIGGMFTSISGSGVDICSFSILSLLFRVTEKVSTPTSVILMGTNSLVGFFYRQLMTNDGISEEAWGYFTVCVPVVVLGAPFGSFLASHFHRLVLAYLVYLLDTVAMVTAFVVLTMTWQLWVFSACNLVIGALFFTFIGWAGKKLLKREEMKELEKMKKLEADDVISIEDMDEK